MSTHTILHPRRANRVDLPSQDDWYGERDPKKRKKIQDRLAQRARRKRQAEARLITKSSPAAQSKEVFSLGNQSSNHIHSSTTSNSSASNSSASNSSNTPNPTITTTPPIPNYMTLGPPKAQTLLAAILTNGILLGLTCGGSFPSKSRPAGPEIPPSLVPTLLQLSTVHWQWIDRFPFPDARDEMIIQSGEINEEDFIWDLFNMETFRIAPGAQPWDPAAYTICPDFALKWGFLFPSF